jgi:hypothetical protein
MAEDKMQQQRFELKYVISEDIALGIRDYARSFLELDEYGVGKPNYAYTIHSLYLDSDDLRLYWETINGTKNRFKMRLRYYDENPASPVFFEIKRRMNDCILKQRGGVRRDSVHWLLRGHIPEVAHLTSKDPKQLVALQRFCDRMSTLQAAPKVHISYLREAWVTSENNSIRLTLDRDVRAERDVTGSLSADRSKSTLTAFGNNVILELKFTSRYPLWWEDLTRRFSLFRGGAAKYVEGVTVLGEDMFLNGMEYRARQPLMFQDDEPLDGVPGKYTEEVS